MYRFYNDVYFLIFFLLFLLVVTFWISKNYLIFLDSILFMIK